MSIKLRNDLWYDSMLSCVSVNMYERELIFDARPKAGMYSTETQSVLNTFFHKHCWESESVLSSCLPWSDKILKKVNS